VLPVLASYELFGVPRMLGSYALALATAWSLAFLGALYEAHRGKLDVGRVAALGGIVTGAAFAGASGLFVVVELLRGVPLADALGQGGRVLFGAYLGALAAGAFAAKRLRVPLIELLDVSVPWFAFAHASGRVGCFLAGCCFGREFHGAWAVTATHPLSPAAHPSVPRHPVQLYEAVAMALVGVALRFVPVERRGLRVTLFFGAVCVVRLVTESLRADVVRGVFGPLATSGWLSLLGLLGAAVFAFRFRFASHKG
jgi:phosphatidylglycerol:prolipoprotein diacylglycerol transferase